MEGFELEVHSAMDLRVTVSDKSYVDEEVIDARLVAGSVVGSIAGSALGIVAARDPEVADAIGLVLVSHVVVSVPVSVIPSHMSLLCNKSRAMCSMNTYHR